MKQTHTSALMVSLREKSGLTQKQISKRLGFTTSQFISNIERGKAPLPPKHFKKIARILKTSPNLICYCYFQDVKEKTYWEAGLTESAKIERSFIS